MLNGKYWIIPGWIWCDLYDAVSVCFYARDQDSRIMDVIVVAMIRIRNIYLEGRALVTGKPNIACLIGIKCYTHFYVKYPYFFGYSYICSTKIDISFCYIKCKTIFSKIKIWFIVDEWREVRGHSQFNCFFNCPIIMFRFIERVLYF